MTTLLHRRSPRLLAAVLLLAFGTLALVTFAPHSHDATHSDGCAVCKAAQSVAMLAEYDGVSRIWAGRADHPTRASSIPPASFATERPARAPPAV